MPRWTAFLERFPTVEACAGSSLGDVLREWQGLGYPRRARQLHMTAQRVIELGGFPRDIEGLTALPGIGAYTARALMAFAFELDAAVVDTNVARVYARVSGVRLTAKQAQRLADEACPSGSAWVWNQCLIDLGATVCRPLDPSCGDCPVRVRCVWHGGPATDPAIGSSGVSRAQARFEGSDRQARGRLMKALTAGPVDGGDVAGVMQRDEATAARLVTALVSEGMCRAESEVLSLPD